MEVWISFEKEDEVEIVLGAMQSNPRQAIFTVSYTTFVERLMLVPDKRDVERMCHGLGRVKGENKQ